MTDEHWYLVQSCLSRQPGISSAEDRRIMEAVLYILRSGKRWEDLPDSFGDQMTALRRFRVWCLDGSISKAWRFLLFEGGRSCALELRP